MQDYPRMTENALIEWSKNYRGTDEDRRAIAIAHAVEPKFRAGSYGCGSHTAKRWLAAYHSALFTIVYDRAALTALGEAEPVAWQWQPPKEPDLGYRCLAVVEVEWMAEWPPSRSGRFWGRPDEHLGYVIQLGVPGMHGFLPLPAPPARQINREEG